jgi:hypothetical protein
MSLKKILKEIAKVIIEEADQNSEFSARLEAALGVGKCAPIAKKKTQSRKTGTPKRANRRTPAVYDPVELARQGENVLRSRLAELDLEKLKDIVADYGMDQGKLVMKWKLSEKIIHRIVEISLARAVKGEAFFS